MKSVSEHTVIQSAYKEAGILRGAAAICGTTHKTVKRILEAAGRAMNLAPRPPVDRSWESPTNRRKKH